MNEKSVKCTVGAGKKLQEGAADSDIKFEEKFIALEVGLSFEMLD